jgi:hypothetical protein
MRYDDGVPGGIEDLDPTPVHNRPYGYETHDITVLLAHIRALSGFVAQLRDRVSELEKKIG